jgi:protein SCO1
MPHTWVLTRRRFGALAATAAAFGSVPPAVAAASGADVRGRFPDLAFTMTRASDGKIVTAADFRGRVAILYFGFTRCPDTCPTTMQNAARVLQQLGPLAQRLRVLFVTVDLAYDTLPRLKAWLAGFGSPPQIDGLRGTPAQLAALAKRYAVGYTAASRPDAPDPVAKISHTAAVYLFDDQGRVQRIVGQMALASADIQGIAAGLEPLARRASG